MHGAAQLAGAGGGKALLGVNDIPLVSPTTVMRIVDIVNVDHFFTSQQATLSFPV
jgi:hypothetical protein